MSVLVPTNWTPVITNTAKLNAQTATGTAQVTLQYPQPTVSSISPRNAFLVRDANSFVPTTITGSGIYPGGTYTFDNAVANTIPINATFNSMSFTDVFTTLNWDPKPHTLTISSPSDGHGGGTSNAFAFTFLGNQNMTAVNPNAGAHGEIYHVSQGGGSAVHVFDLSTHAHLRDFSLCSNCLAYGVAVDDVTGYLVITSNSGQVVYYKPDGTIAPTSGGAIQPNALLGAAVGGGNGCVSEDLAGNIGYFQTQQFTGTLPTIPISGTPFGVKVMTVNAKQYCLVGTVENAGAQVVSLPDGNLVGEVSFSGLTPLSQTSANGGFPLELLSNGATQILASYFRADGVLILTDVSTPSNPRIVQTVNLTAKLQSLGVTGDAFHVAADPTNNRIILALTDYSSDGTTMITRFVAINASTGAVATLTSTSSNYSAGFAISPNGTTLIVCQDASCDFQPSD